MDVKLKDVLFELQLELCNQPSNDWSNDEHLKYYLKGIEYAIDRLIEKIEVDEYDEL